VRFVSEGGYTSVSEYCGGVSCSELPVGIWLHFSDLGSISGGRSCFFWTCVSSWIKLLLYQVHLYFVLDVFHHLLCSYIDIYSKLVFPGGVLSRVMSTKNTCVKFPVLECRTTVFSAVKICRCVTFILVCMC
jgi:hypothetical protein